ncbi:MAG: hypothetical protein JXR49_09200 [Acidobacteria bacterium]|nr:hypothetical protein [Acidobacteriota bacterium]
MKSESGTAAARLVFGLLIIAVGILFLLGNMGVLNPHAYLRLWPVLLIVAGLIFIVQPQRGPRCLLGIVLVIIGALMILNRLYFIHFSFRDYWPLILIIVGVMMILNHSIFSRDPYSSPGKTADASSYIKASAILSGLKRKCSSQDFRGGDLTAIMGGFEIDLRDASMDDKAVLDVFIVMGGGEIRVPDDWLVDHEGLPILGGFEDKTHPQKNAEKRLIIRGTAIMGGMEIKN